MKQRKLLIRIFVIAAVITAILTMSAIVYGTNTSSDPLVTLSYLTGTYKSSILSEVNTAITAKEKQLRTDFSKQVDGIKSSLPATDDGTVSNDYEMVTLTAGQTLSLSSGSEVLFLSGTASVDAAGLTDVTAGSSLSAGNALTVNHLYVASGDCKIRATGQVELLVK